MRKATLIFFFNAIAFLAAAQQTDSAQRVIHSAAKDNVSLPTGRINWLFIGAVALLIGSAVYIILRFMRGNNGGESVGWGRKKSRSSGKGKKRHKSRSDAKSGFQDIQSAAVPTQKVAEIPAAENIPKSIEKAVLTPEPAKIETIAPPVVAVPEVFYMTVPGADGRFWEGARKNQPTGCLYRFELPVDKPAEASISFSGTEEDMRNAQAFRDLELLPACTFEGIPDEGSFRFSQKPGRAFFDGTAWAVKEKISIRFQ